VSADSAIEVDVITSVEGRYDDNINSEADNEEDDFIALFVLGLEAVSDGRTLDWSLSGELTQEVYTDNSDFTNFGQGLDFAVSKELSKTTAINFSNNFAHYEQPATFEDNFGREAGIYESTLNRMTVDVDQEWGRAISSVLGYGFEYYEADLATIEDSSFHRIFTNIAYDQSNRFSYFLGMEAGFREYEQGNDLFRHNAEVGVRQAFDDNMTLELAVGAVYFEVDNSDDDVEPRYRVSFNRAIDDRSTLSMSFIQSAEPLGYSNDVFDAWRFKLDWFYDLTSRLNLTCAAFWVKGNIQ
jgi:hypothetical protein